MFLSCGTHEIQPLVSGPANFHIPCFQHGHLHVDVHVDVFVKDSSCWDQPCLSQSLAIYYLTLYGHKYITLALLHCKHNTPSSLQTEWNRINTEIEIIGFCFLHVLTTFFCHLSTTCSHEINISKLQDTSNDLKDISNFFLCETHHLHSILARTRVHCIRWDYQGPCYSFSISWKHCNLNTNQLIVTYCTCKQFVHCSISNWSTCLTIIK